MTYIGYADDFGLLKMSEVRGHPRTFGEVYSWKKKNMIIVGYNLRTPSCQQMPFGWFVAGLSMISCSNQDGPYTK